jgi:hypothetical protein
MEPRETHIVVDDSQSMDADLFARVRDLVIAIINRWVREAAAGDALTLWWLTGGSAAYPADQLELRVPLLHPPVYVHRRRLSQQFATDVAAVFAKMPRPRETRLLEAVFLLSSTRNRLYRLMLITDLQQDSEGLSLAPDTVCRLGDDDLVRRMLRVCPRVPVPPQQVELSTYPGRTTEDQTSPATHGKLRAVYSKFFSQWAPGAPISYAPIK